jgi:hypothetical protein
MEHPGDPGGHPVQAAEKLAEICGVRTKHGRGETTMKPGGRKAIEESQNGELTVPNPPAQLSAQGRSDTSISDRGRALARAGRDFRPWLLRE